MFLGKVNEQEYQAMVKKSDELLGKLYLHHPQTVLHCQQVSLVAQKFMKDLKWDREDITLGTMAASLHDIGKLRVDAGLLNKSSAISILEHIQLDAHGAHTENILREAGVFPEGFIRMAADHHEHLDGSGYPKKLKGDQISQGARLLAIVDSYVSMLEDRPTQLARTKEQALEYLRKTRDIFDPELLEQFIQMMEKG